MCWPPHPVSGSPWPQRCGRQTEFRRWDWQAVVKTSVFPGCGALSHLGSVSFSSLRTWTLSWRGSLQCGNQSSGRDLSPWSSPPRRALSSPLPSTPTSLPPQPCLDRPSLVAPHAPCTFHLPAFAPLLPSAPCTLPTRFLVQLQLEPHPLFSKCFPHQQG